MSNIEFLLGYLKSVSKKAVCSEFKELEVFYSNIRKSGVYKENHILSCPSKYYKITRIPKKDNDFRTLEIPNDNIKYFQELILEEILNKFPFTENVFAVKNKGILENAVFHKEKSPNILLKLDIYKCFQFTSPKKFINSINFTFQDKSEFIKNLFLSIKNICFIRDLKNSITKLPTGAPTSPAIANISLHLLDLKILNYLKSLNNENIKYSRYIDDLTFSMNSYPLGFQKEINNLVKSCNYRINHKKSQLLYKNNNTQSITGITINGNGISRKYRESIRYLLFKYAKEGRELDDHLKGKLNFIKQVNPPLYMKFKNNFLELVSKYELSKSTAKQIFKSNSL